MAASSVALGQDRVCVDGTDRDDCLAADPNITYSNGEPASPIDNGLYAPYGGFGGYFTAGRAVVG